MAYDSSLYIKQTHYASDRKVADSMPVFDITLLCPWEKHLTLIPNLCGVEDSTGICFTTAYVPKKKIKKQTDMVLPVSPKVGLGNNCPLLHIYDVVKNTGVQESTPE